MAKRSKAKRRRRAPSAAGADFISGLCDDLLVRVLELLPDARDAVRTGALSRRWRGLWTRVHALRFARSSKPDDESSFCRAMRGARRYAAFVSRTLELRAARGHGGPAGAGVEHLAISFAAGDNKDGLRTPPPFLSAVMAPAWVRYAVQNAVRSFVIELRRRDPTDYLFRRRMDSVLTGSVQNNKKRVVDLDALPSSADLEAMRLELDYAIVRLPAAAEFASLADLALESICLDAGGGDLLGRLLSPACCPSLRKLRLARLAFAAGPVGLAIENGALSELWVEEVMEVVLLVLATPGLRVLHIDARRCDQLQELVVSAPRLEELTCLCLHHPLWIDVADAGWPCMRKLQVELFSHEDTPDDDVNDHSVFLLQRCSSSIRCLDVSLEVPEREVQVFDLIKGRIPQFPHVTSLIVHVSLRDNHSLGAGVASLLTQCFNLNYLSLHLCYNTPWDDSSESDYFCDHPDQWTSSELSLVHLQHVELNGLIGTACELRFIRGFIRFVLAGATKLQKVTLRSEPMGWRKGNKDAFKHFPPQVSKIWDRDSYLLYKWRRCLCEEIGELTCLE